MLYNRSNHPGMYRGARMTTKAYLEEARRLDHALEGIYWQRQMQGRDTSFAEECNRAAQNNLRAEYDRSNGKVA
jgi:hypothetical protein